MFTDQIFYGGAERYFVYIDFTHIYLIYFYFGVILGHAE